LSEPFAKTELGGTISRESTLVEVSRLARPGVRVEIEAISGIPHP
jgi:enamine deaminase RidA (YjgF/YER057c/UK114 family)